MDDYKLNPTINSTIQYIYTTVPYKLEYLVYWIFN